MKKPRIYFHYDKPEFERPDYLDENDEWRKDPRFSFTIDWFINEDIYFTTLEKYKYLNKRRHKNVDFVVRLCGMTLTFIFPYKHVGEVFYGRDLSKKKDSL